MNSKRWTALVVTAAMLAGACSGDDDPSGGVSTTVPGDDSDPTSTSGSTSGSGSGTDGGTGGFGSTDDDSGAATLGIRLSNGTSVETGVADVAVVDGTPLSDAEVGAVLDRLPAWDLPDDDAAEFRRPVDSLSPPTVGETIDATFPPTPDAPSVPDASPDGPLEVLRTQPEGDVDVAPFVALTFDQPMVDLATLDQLDDLDVPVTIEPDISETAGIDGRWRWIGARTLRFEVTPEPGADDNGALDRLPAATEYTVTVPAGTESANGAALGDAVSFGFSTPAARPAGVFGVSDSMPLEPVFVATFDQRVDPEAVLEVISFEAGDVSGVRLATDAEVEASSQASSIVARELPGRSVAFVPTSPLSPDTGVVVEVGPGVPSLEGPLVGDGSMRESGRTYPPLEVDRVRCADRCRPLQPVSIEFSNPLDLDAFDPDWVSVEPSVPGVRVQAFGAAVQLSGATSANTTYTVTVSADVVDVFGQTLGDEVVEEFDVGDASPFLVGPDRRFVTVDPFSESSGLSYSTVNHESLAVTAWRVEPDEYDEFQEYLDSTYADVRPPDPDWPVVLDTTVTIDGDDDAVTETVVDLDGAFDESGGPIVVRVEPDPGVDPGSDEWFSNRPVVTFVQRTEVGVDAFVVENELVAWVTDLTTGEPIPDVALTASGRSGATTTGADGVARFDLGAGSIDALVAVDGDRTGFLPSQRFNGWEGFDRGDESRWYVVDDRGIYRPGETARITGLVRRLDSDAQLDRFGGERFVAYRAYDPFGNEIAASSVPVNSAGGFNLSVEVPEASNTGGAYVEMSLVESAEATNSNINSFHEFQVQDFRTPDYEVDVRPESEPPFYVADPATIAVDAEYFAGGPLGDAEVNWFVSANDTSYSPPDWNDFSFGVWTPWWFGFGGGEFGGDFSGGGFSGDVVSDGGFVDECFDCGPFGGDPRFQEFVARTDASGTHVLQLDFTDIPASNRGTGDDQNGDDQSGDDEPAVVDQPTSVTAEATVFDVNRQAISSRTNLLVHPARFYVGLRSDRGFVEQGQPIVIDTTVVDVDGEPVAGREFDVVAGRLDSTFRDGRYVEELVDEQTCTVTSTDDVSNDDIDESMRCEFETEVGGQYRITAVVVDDDGRSNRAEYTQWVSGASARPTRDLTEGDVVVVPDTEFHAPGDTAEILVQSPFAPASGLLTVTRAGVEEVRSFDAPDGSAVLDIDISSDDVPNLDVRVDMVGTEERVGDDGTPRPDVPPQPAYATGRVRLQIPPVERTLDVVATPAAENVLPGDSTQVDVTVAGADGAPVGDAGVVLIVVDEAVLSLSGYDLDDPLDAFYSPVEGFVDAQQIRDSIVLANPDLFGQDSSGTATTEAMEEGAMDESAAGGDDAMESVAADGDVATDDAAAPVAAGRAGAAGEAPIDVRNDFDALAVFAPDETTGADGSVTVSVDLPDNLTRYRVMAFASAGDDRFGSGESAITARLPVSVRPTAPRFLNFGDTFELPVVVQNRNDEAVEVDIAIEVSNLGLAGEGDAELRSAGRRVTVPANDRIEVRFPASAAEVGTARFRVASVSSEFVDAAEVDLPVYTPATSEAFATYGVLDGDAPVAQPVAAPTDVFPQFGGLEVSTSSTALQALTDAVLYLYDYRYANSDGLATRIMAVAALRDVLDAFDADGLPDAGELDDFVAGDVERLQDLQNDDGGFPYWQRGRPSIPWVSVTAAHALVLAAANDYPVDGASLDAALSHLRSIEDFIPATYSDETRDAIGAYALYVRDLAGDSDPTKALDLYRRGVDETLQLDSVARLWNVIEDDSARTEIASTIENSAVETAAAATFATSYGEDAYLIAHSDRRTDGVVLDALVAQAPDSDLIPKVVAGLLGSQTRGRWNNAYENSFILLALNEYFDTFESVDPDFVARAWLGDTYAVEAEFRGRSTDTSLTTVPMSELVDGVGGGDGGPVDLVVDKDGEGRLYYRLGLTYAPADLDLDPRDEGFVVERSYEAVDDESDVVRRDDGTWEIAAGATVRVNLTMVADARRTHVALVDPLPAGLEAVNPSLATSLTVPAGDPSTSYSGSWWWQWYEHQNLRDDRAEAFTSFLPGGTYEYSYVARATTPGEFVVPPTRAEEIYAPEVFGRSSSDRVVVS